MCAQHLATVAAEGSAFELAAPRPIRLGNVDAIEITFLQAVIVDRWGDTLEEVSRRGAEYMAVRSLLIKSPVGTLACTLQGTSTEDHMEEEALTRFCGSIRR
jgi:hypothetical protein